MQTKPSRRDTVAVLLFIAIGLSPSASAAHCDSLAGPVVQDARLALERGDPAPALKWVPSDREKEIRDAFEEAVAVRVLSEDAQRLADRSFFETLVRIHRAGEGEPFTALKPADDVDPGLVAADEALQGGSVDALADRLSAAVAEGVRKRFAVAAERRRHASASVPAGREFVEAYVDYVHFVESADRLTRSGAPHRHTEAHGSR
jgi:hypothetical protein